MKNKLTYIIDDDKISVKLMNIIISKNRFCEQIDSFYNPQFALDILKLNCTQNEKLPDVILLDINMRVMDGWQFLDEFIQLPIKKNISVFMITSSIDPFDIEMTKKYSVVKEYIMKPITAEKLNKICSSIDKMN